MNRSGVSLRWPSHCVRPIEIASRAPKLNLSTATAVITEHGNCVDEPRSHPPGPPTAGDHRGRQPAKARADAQSTAKARGDPAPAAMRRDGACGCPASPAPRLAADLGAFRRHQRAQIACRRGAHSPAAPAGDARRSGPCEKSPCTSRRPGNHAGNGACGNHAGNGACERCQGPSTMEG
ncbi:hypothetical protein T492DRAFT_74060 [Pavlovales sp. CCMP2436]|nr:hypothetical protein T492DRAFT_74060 [Pavlovales sp. CCMP2436]